MNDSGTDAFMAAKLLPPGFETLEPFVGDWALATETERSRKRNASSMGEIRTFYDAIFPQAERALSHLSQFPDSLPDQATRSLLQLLLALAEISVCIENFDNPGVVDGFDVGKIEFCHERLGNC